jgi:hypothetical protein
MGASLVHFFLQSVLLAALVVFRYSGRPGVRAADPPGAPGAAVLLAGAGDPAVRAQRLRPRPQHLLELLLLAWFWLTPIVYPYMLPWSKLSGAGPGWPRCSTR